MALKLTGPDPIAIYQGQQVTVTLMFSRSGGKPQTATFEALSLPLGMVASFSPATARNNSEVRLTLTAAMDAAVGDHSAIIAARTATDLATY